MNFQETFALHVASKTRVGQTVTVGDLRVSVLSSRLIRVEVGSFTDSPTQKVWYRDFEQPSFTHKQVGHTLVIETGDAVFTLDLRKNRLTSIALDGRRIQNFKKGNLKGTYRTLDGTIGPIMIGNGVVSTKGAAFFDDSKSLLLSEDGRICPREGKVKDLYYFAFGNQYRDAVKALFCLTGEVPLVPRYALGNWWSRYKAYSQQEYIDLMEKFKEKQIPITVATIDMDWHWVDVAARFGSEIKRAADPKQLKNIWWSNGWTGYSWNTELFPDYKGFLNYLKQNNYKITVNMHPSDGVRSFEDQYEAMAAAMGVDPASKQPVAFDITDPKFVEAYFSLLHHPYEKDGVDFWWIDWQQGHNSKLKGLDPLWALNHYHYLDSCKENKRGMILSRYAEIGSHRYPLGFSGDTMVCWPCYRFQPYFTATASNVGYTWWSHDIGGHHMARKDDELYLRWLQFGVFSPVNRLHSTSNEFMGKEPWKFRWDVEQLAVEYLRLRHRLIPYLYSMNYRTHAHGLGLIEPMYYAYPGEAAAYRVPNQYLFGSELIVAPVTERLHKKTNLAGTQVWLPQGRYTDILNGRIYQGGKTYKLFRGVEGLPVLAKAGAIIPLDHNGSTNLSSNPAELDWLIYRGSNNFILYEDDGVSRDFEKGAFATRKVAVKEEGKQIAFTVYPYEGDKSVVCSSVIYHLHFKDIVEAEAVTVTKNGVSMEWEQIKGDTLTLLIKDIGPEDKIAVLLHQISVLQNRNTTEALVELVSKFQAGVGYKKRKFTKFVFDPNKMPAAPAFFKEPLTEIMQLWQGC